MHNFFTILLLLVCLYTNKSVAGPMSEKDVIIKALELNSSIRISKIDQISDSLTYEQQRLLRLPQISFFLTPSIIPHQDNSEIIQSLLIDTSEKRTENTGSVNLSQDLPMGASIATEFNQFMASKIPVDTVHWESSLSLSFKQQLLKGAFKHDSVSVSLKIASIDNKQKSLSFKKCILSEITKVRILYWNYYLNRTMESIARQQLEYAKNQREIALNRFSIGEVSEIDTLSALLEELRLSQSLISANYTSLETRADLATALQITTDSVFIPDSLQIDIKDLPDPQELISSARNFDPDIEILSLLREKYTLYLEQTNNSILPSLEAKASYTMDRNGDHLLSSNQSKRKNLVLSLLFSYSLPHRSRSIEVSKARLQIKSNEIDAQQRQTKLLNDIEKLQQNWKKEKSKIELASTAVTVSQKQLTAAQQGYELGSINRLELLKAQNDYNQAQIEYLQGLVEMKLLEISLEEITGKVFNRFGVQL